MDLLIGHQPLKIILLSFLVIMINGDVLRLQPVTLPSTFTIPPNVSTSDLVAANKIKIIGYDIYNNEIIEKEDKDIIHIQSISPKFNRTHNKRKKIRNPVRVSESKIVNVGNFLQPKIPIRINSPLPNTVTKRSPQISQINIIPDQTESIIFNSFLTTAIPQKLGPYVYERPDGEPFEIENKISYSQTELPITTNKPKYLYQSPTFENENQFSYSQTEIPITTKKPKYLYEKPTGIPFEIEDRFGQENIVLPIATESKYLYNTHTAAPSEIEPIISQNYQTEKSMLTSIVPDLKYDTHTAAPSEIKPLISKDKQTERPILSSTTATDIKPIDSKDNQTEKHISTSTAPPETKPIISQNKQTEKPMLTDIKPAFVQISGGNGKFDIRTLRVLNPKKRKHRKKNRKNRKMDKNILDNEIVKIKVN